MGNRLDEIEVSPKLNQRVDEVLHRIERKHRRSVMKRWLIGIGSAAVVFIAVFMLGVSNPALAARLPLIGHIFERVEGNVSDKGAYSQNATKLIEEESKTEQGQEQVQEQNPYVQTSNGITFSFSEITATERALYLAVSVENEEAFSDYIMRKNVEWDLDYIWLYLKAEGTIDDMAYVPSTADYMQGQFLDDHTFIGIIRVDVAHLTDQPTDAELQEDSANAGQKVIVPDGYTYHLEISAFGWRADGKREFLEGDWSFDFKVENGGEGVQTVEVNGMNEQGEGIASVVRNPYEIYVNPIIPDGKEAYEYMAIVCDAEGDLLDWQGEYADTFQTWGRNTDTVYVYLCDSTEYLDELSLYYWSEDYAEKKKTKTFAQYLSEHALFGTEVTF